MIESFRVDLCGIALTCLQRLLQKEGIGQINAARLPIVLQHIERFAFPQQFRTEIKLQRKICRCTVGQKQDGLGIVRLIAGYSCPAHQLGRRPIVALHRTGEAIPFLSLCIHKYQIIAARLGQFGKLHVGTQRLHRNLIGILLKNSIKTGIGHHPLADDCRRRGRAVQHPILIHDLSIEQACRIYRILRKARRHRCRPGNH